MKPIIVCGFPGIGKSFTALNNHTYWSVDLDSSKFNNNPDFSFPDGYIDEAEKLINKGGPDFIFMSTHEEVRRELKRREIPYALVYPAAGEKSNYLSRYTGEDRGAISKDTGFLDRMEEKFVEFVESVESDPHASTVLELSDDQTLDDVLDYIRKEF